MNFQRRSRIVVVLFGLTALGLGFFFQSGAFAGRSQGSRQREELHRVVDSAQLWYIRSATRGGGEGSFERIDFQRIGLSREAGAMNWRGVEGEYKIEGATRDYFILTAKDNRGVVFLNDTLEFDAWPEVK